jgi:tetratricopeptide (TPR) repeat protein
MAEIRGITYGSVSKSRGGFLIGEKVHTGILLSMTILTVCGVIQGQGKRDSPSFGLSIALSNAPLARRQQEELAKAVHAHEYVHAEKLLLSEINSHPHSSELLRILGGVFFLDGKYLNSAIAYKKAEALAPLDAPSRYTLAMAYIVLKHPDWARPELEKLERLDPHSPLYPYWLSRLDYDAMRFKQAIEEARQAIKVDSNFMKAYDSLGLCYEALGQYDKAVSAYRQALQLNQKDQAPSPWPCLNLGALLVKLGHLDEAKSILAEALRIDPRFPSAHFELGLLLEREGKYRASLIELQKAIQFDPSYADPYFILGRIYQRLGEKEKAERALGKFHRLKSSTLDTGS